MAIAVNGAVAQVLARLAEDVDSPLAELPDAAGGTAALTSDQQIILYLNEGQEALALMMALPIYGSGSLAGTTLGRIAFTALTMTVTGQRFWKIIAARWGSDPLQVSDMAWYRTHNPDPMATGTPERAYQEEITAAMLAPRPASSGTLTLEGYVLPRPGTAGNNFEDLPEALAPRLYAYACWRVCLSLIEEPKFASALKGYEAEWKQA